MEHIRQFHEQDSYGEKLLYGDHYLAMLYNNFMPQLIEMPISAQWFMQDEARSYTANVIFDFLYETFGPRVIYHYPGCHNCGQV
jgi:hypothetical protein